MGKGQWSAYALSLRNFATFRYAQEFHATAQKTGAPVVRTYLLGHAIELYLKAFLLRAGLTSTALRSKKNYGHNLDKLLTEAKKRHRKVCPRLAPDGRRPCQAQHPISRNAPVFLFVAFAHAAATSTVGAFVSLSCVAFQEARKSCHGQDLTLMRYHHHDTYLPKSNAVE